MNSEMTQFTQMTPIIDYDNPTVSAFAKENAGASSDHMEQAISLYYAVRDGFRYDPYKIDLSVEGLRASTTLKNGYGWCVPKAVLLAACCRLLGIPARLGYADVRNHLSTKRMREEMETDIFKWHGYTAIYLNGDWIKATPAFNIELCEKFKLKPLEFDGRNDSIFHPFDLVGNKHMEYLKFRGEYPDVPLDEIEKTFQEQSSYVSTMKDADFDQDVEQEILDD